MITIDQEVNCLDCLNGKVYICSNSMQDTIDCKCNGNQIDILVAVSGKVDFNYRR